MVWNLRLVYQGNDQVTHMGPFYGIWSSLLVNMYRFQANIIPFHETSHILSNLYMWTLCRLFLVICLGGSHSESVAMFYHNIQHIIITSLLFSLIHVKHFGLEY